MRLSLKHLSFQSFASYRRFKGDDTLSRCSLQRLQSIKTVCSPGLPFSSNWHPTVFRYLNILRQYWHITLWNIIISLTLQVGINTMLISKVFNYDGYNFFLVILVRAL